MPAKDRAEITDILNRWAEAVRYGRKGSILADHLADSLIFDVLVPLQYQGAESYRRSFDEWQPPFQVPILFELSEVRITAGAEVGFAHCLIDCGGTLPDGQEVRDRVRATFGFLKTEGAWMFTHQHISLPRQGGKHPLKGAKTMKANPVGWFEIYVQNLSRAREFYETVLGTKLEPLPSPVPGLEMLTFPMERDACGAAGSLVRMEGGPSGGNAVLVYFNCEDCAVEEGRVAAAGGQVERPKMSIGEYGFITLVRDPDGNMIGLHSMQ